MDEFEIKFYTKVLGSTALIYPLLERMGIRQIIDEIVGPSEADISPGKVIEILVNNRLNDPEPLYDVESWARENAIEEVYGVKAEQLNDDRLARQLDRIHPYLEEAKSAIALHIGREFKVDYRKFHYDLSSFYFEGEYANQKEGYVKLCYGHSSDHHPDKIQAKLELKVAHDGYVAFDYRLLDGNTSDMKAASVVENMEKLKHAANLDNLVRISDRGTHSRANAVGVIESGGQYLATVRLSPHYRSLFLEADSMGQVQWKPIEYVAYHEAGKAEEKRTKYWVWEVEDNLSYKGKEYPVRNLYFLSSRRQRQDRERREKELKKAKAGLERIARLVNKYDYKSVEVVRSRVEKLLWKSEARKYVKYQVKEPECGKIQFGFELDKEKLEEDARFEGVFLIQTNSQGTEREILADYKGQPVMEGRVSKLKGSIKLRPIFLHKQERIESLVFVIFLALMAYCLVEREYRCHVSEEKEKHITTGKLLEAFKYLSLVHLTSPREVVKVAELNSLQQTILRRLGLPEPKSYIGVARP